MPRSYDEWADLVTALIVLAFIFGGALLLPLVGAR